LGAKDIFKEFSSPRYRYTGGGENHLNFIDQETGTGITVFFGGSKPKSGLIDGNFEKVLTSGKKDIEVSPIPFEEEIRLIVGITIGGRIPRWIGAHALVMYIDNPHAPLRDMDGFWRNDIMLDASGQFGTRWGIRSIASDIVVPERFPSQITIDSYRRYFYPRVGEMWYTYSYSIDREFGTHIHGLIREKYQRTSFQCAIKASTLLQRSGLFDGIEVVWRPAGIKRFLDRYTPVKRNIMRLVDKSVYDLGVSPPRQQSWA